jgi:hypothetical protein
MIQGDKVVHMPHSLNRPGPTLPRFSRQSVSPCRILLPIWTRWLCPTERTRPGGEVDERGADGDAAFTEGFEGLGVGAGRGRSR